MNVEIDIQQLKYEASVIPESDMLDHPHNVTVVIGVLIHQILEQFGLVHGKLVVQLRIPIDLNCHLTACLVVNSLDHLCKGALPQWLNDFISEQDLLANLNAIVILIIIYVPHVGILHLLLALSLENVASKVHLIIKSIILNDFILLLHGHQVGISFQKFGPPDRISHILRLHMQEWILIWLLLLRHLKTVTILIRHVLWL